MSCCGEGPEQNESFGACGGMAQPEDLVKYVDLSGVSSLNTDTKTHPRSVIESKNGILKSNNEVDHQLIVVIPFNEAVKLSSIRFTGVSKADGESGPKTVKLFVDMPNISFNDVEDITPTQVVALGAKDLQGDKDIVLKFVKFQRVRSITLFFEENQGDSDVTVINNVTFIGSPVEGTNMKNLKKSG